MFSQRLADTEPPTASIFTEKNFTNAAHVTIFITFSEACTGHGGFKCVNASSCNVSHFSTLCLLLFFLMFFLPYVLYMIIV